MNEKSQLQTYLRNEILVVDDEPGFRALFRYMLEPRGFNVSTMNDGFDGFSAAMNKNFGIIFLDDHMPRMSGPEVLRQIKAIKPYQNIVLLSSNHDAAQTNEVARLAGAFACLQKPFEIKDLWDIIEKIVGPTAHESERSN